MRLSRSVSLASCALRTRAGHVAMLVVLGTIIPWQASHAYVGPGLGLGAIAAVLGVIGSVLLALFAVIWYPIKRLLKRRKSVQDAAAAGDSDQD